MQKVTLEQLTCSEIFPYFQFGFELNYQQFAQ